MAVETSCMLMKRRQKNCSCMDGMGRWNESFSACPRNKRKVGNLTKCGINYLSTGLQHLSSAGKPPFRLGLHIEYPPSARRLGPQREAKDLGHEFRFVSDWFLWSGEFSTKFPGQLDDLVGCKMSSNHFLNSQASEGTFDPLDTVSSLFCHIYTVQVETEQTESGWKDAFHLVDMTMPGLLRTSPKWIKTQMVRFKIIDLSPHLQLESRWCCFPFVGCISDHLQ